MYNFVDVDEIALNSHICEKKRVQGNGEEKTGDRRKGTQKGTPTSGAEAPIILLRSGAWHASSSLFHVSDTRGGGDYTVESFELTSN